MNKNIYLRLFARSSHASDDHSFRVDFDISSKSK